MTDPQQDLQLTLAITEVNQILEALGQRTYADVYRLVSKIQQQADRQLSERENAPGRDLAAPEDRISGADQPSNQMEPMPITTPKNNSDRREAP